MIQYQETFTNAEQSIKLLELGLPIDSANIALLDTPDSPYDPYIIGGDIALRQRLREGRGVPSWSVGRLLQIWQKCTGCYYVIYKGDRILEALIDSIEYVVINKYADFSKLQNHK